MRSRLRPRRRPRPRPRPRPRKRPCQDPNQKSWNPMRSRQRFWSRSMCLAGTMVWAVSWSQASRRMRTTPGSCFVRRTYVDGARSSWTRDQALR
ncbi:hypothetical protein EBZ80_12890 [bacterium]|nr:hypothetical protein [bacterium]